MGYAVVHMMKIKSGAVGGIQSHNNREHKPRTNPDVDMSRSADNYDLVPCDNYKKAIKEKISALVESSRAVRKDAVVVCNFIVTSDYETMTELGAEKQRAFFEDSLKWFADRYGADRILNATVHMDENTPHLHIGVMPITRDGRLSAKAIFTKTEMKAIQTEFARDVGARYGLERGVEGSERTHLSEARFKEAKAIEMANESGAVAEILQQESEQYRQELAETRQSLETVKNDISALDMEKAHLRGDILAIEADMSDLEKESAVLQEQIANQRRELAVVRSAVKQEMDDGARQFGMAAMQERIAEARKEAERANRLNLLEKFVSLSQIKPLFDNFCELMRTHHRDRNGRDER